MTKQIVHLTSKYSVGCTFLDWSLHWLSGKNNTISVESNNPHPLTSDPVRDNIAHNNYKKIHPGRLVTIKETIKKLKKIDYNDLITIYWHADRLTSSDDTVDIRNRNNELIIEAWNWLCSQGYLGIFLEFPGPKMYLDQPRETADIYGNVFDNHKQVLFADFKILFPDKEVPSNIWDLREQYALNLRPYEELPLIVDIDRNYPHYYLTTNDWYFNGQEHIRNIMKFIGKDIDESRWNHWVTVYQKWSALQKKIINFCNNVESFVKDIVDGNDNEIGPLTLRQEVIIQHLLMYKYNLNLKTWQLESFPNNTKDLHNLLEPNIHNLENIYDR